MGWHNTNPSLGTLVEHQFFDEWKRSLGPQEGNDAGGNKKKFLKDADRKWHEEHPDEPRQNSRIGIIFLKTDRDQYIDDLNRWFVPWAIKQYGGQIKYRSLDAFREKHPGAIHDFLEWFYSAESPVTGKPYSASTCQKVRTEMVKLFELTAEERDPKSGFLPESPIRHFGEITQSRLETKTDAHFNEELHKDFVELCRCFGPRKWKELSHIRGSQLHWDGKAGRYYVQIYNGKGGKDRRAYLYGPKEEIESAIKVFKSVKPNEKICPNPWKNADVHGYRHDYAQRVYDENKRPLEQLTRAEKFYRHLRDGKGNEVIEIFDKKALEITSKNLGHERGEVAVENYLSHGYADDGKCHESSKK